MEDKKLYCTECGYKFVPKSKHKRCPYCGKEGSLIKAPTSQDIIDEVAFEDSERLVKENFK